MQRLIENHLNWAFVYARFGQRDRNWDENKRALFGELPPVVRQIVPAYVRRRMVKAMWGHGMGRHSEEEIHRLGRQDLDSLSDFLGEKRWFMGETPCTLDASAFGLLANILWCPIESPLKEHLNGLKNLTEFCDRVRDRYYARTADCGAGSRG